MQVQLHQGTDNPQGCQESVKAEQAKQISEADENRSGDSKLEGRDHMKCTSVVNTETDCNLNPD